MKNYIMNREDKKDILREYLLTKLLHDFSSGISVIQNMVEFIEESDVNIDDLNGFDILKSSAKTLTAKVEFFREFYNTSSNEELRNWKYILDVCNTLLSNRKIDISITTSLESCDPKLQDAHLLQHYAPNWVTRIIFTVFLTTLEMLKNEGKIKVKIQDNLSKLISITAESDRELYDHPRNDVLSRDVNKKDNNESLSHSNVYCYYALELMRKFGASISINRTKNSIEYVILT